MGNTCTTCKCDGLEYEFTQNNECLECDLIIDNELLVELSSTIEITRKHSELDELDYEHSGHTGFAAILNKTAAEGLAEQEYVPPIGYLIVYSDYRIIYRDDEKVVLPGLKIGDGTTTVQNLPFLVDDVLEELEAHKQNQEVHITNEERTKGNNKVSAEVILDNLILTVD